MLEITRVTAIASFLGITTLSPHLIKWTTLDTVDIDYITFICSWLIITSYSIKKIFPNNISISSYLKFEHHCIGGPFVLFGTPHVYCSLLILWSQLTIQLTALLCMLTASANNLSNSFAKRHHQQLTGLEFYDHFIENLWNHRGEIRIILLLFSCFPSWWGASGGGCI